MITLLDYGAGNVRSVINALEHLGQTVSLVADREDIVSAEMLVFPGVGAFGSMMQILEKKDYIEFNTFGLYLKGLAEIQDLDTIIRDYCDVKFAAGAISPQLMINGLLRFDEETLEKPYLKMIIIAEFYLFLLEREIKNSSAPNSA